MSKARNIADLGSNDVLDTDANGVTVAGNVTLGDNDKAIFGAGSDLQIYHDGNSKIEAVSGYLRLASTTSSTYVDGNNVHIRSGDGGETLARFNDDSDVKLYYDNAIKLATTSTGIDVTGTVTADGLDVSSWSTFGAGGTAGKIRIGNSSGVNFIQSGLDAVSGSDAELRFTDYFGVQKKLSIGANGDISFYEDTGTTPKMVWSASAESLGIGTSSPDTKIHIDQTSQGNFTEAMRISNTGGGPDEGNYIQFEVSNASGYGSRIGGRREGTGGIGLHFYTGAINSAPSETMRISSAGNVGINETNPENKLHVTGPTGAVVGTWYRDIYASAVFEDVESRVQIAAEDSGGDAAALVLSAGAKYWTMAMGGPSNSNELRLIHGVATADGNIGSASQNPYLSIDTGGRIKTPNQPAFTAYTNSSYTLSGGGDVEISLNATLLNRGNHFDVLGNRFTAPASGVYFFTATVSGYITNTSSIGYVDDSMYLTFKKNGAEIAGRNAGSASAMQNWGALSANGVENAVTIQMALSLNVNDYVELELGDLSASQTYVVSNAVFTGYLLG